MGSRSSTPSKHKSNTATQQQMSVAKPSAEEKPAIIIDNDKISYPIIALGDSITKGYYARGTNFHPYSVKLNQLISKASTRVYEFGLSGETTEKMKERLKRLIDKKPSIDDQLAHFIGDNYDNIPENDRGPMHLPINEFRGAIIIGGTNDLAYGFSSEKIANNIIGMYEYCFSRNVDWIVACSIPSSKYDADDSPSLVKVLEKKAKVNELVKEYIRAEQESGRKIIHVDFMNELNYSTCSEEDKNLWDDSLHYTPAGSDRIADILFQHLEKTGWVTN
ncbi:predicted protein [Naegleria gruberi]|uniref:Predicted protein n=1 Tax=Naegleria gruberi TaxID=5762 RepID=D2VNU3_NAEGR|nr:uncharacterized protein NAEGRDRAFT_51083 [Naegleria gruberi]EFC41476.1 predicted protein [Naegleria gruberi]|eukprot:XP_002674220.1 predicted protein [Naegleria gruberi strain NEG-M]